MEQICLQTKSMIFLLCLMFTPALFGASAVAHSQESPAYNPEVHGWLFDNLTSALEQWDIESCSDEEIACMLFLFNSINSINPLSEEKRGVFSWQSLFDLLTCCISERKKLKTKLVSYAKSLFYQTKTGSISIEESFSLWFELLIILPRFLHKTETIPYVAHLCSPSMCSEISETEQKYKKNSRALALFADRTNIGTFSMKIPLSRYYERHLDDDLKRTLAPKESESYRKYCQRMNTLLYFELS